MLGDQIYTIELRGLTYRGRHGVFPEERRLGQAFRVDLRLVYEPGTIDDDLDRAIDYGSVERLVASHVEGEPVNLLETLADRLASALLDAFPLLLRVDVTVHKPEAPLAGTFDDVVVTRTRRRVVRACLGLGSNLGDRRAQLRAAIRRLGSEPGVRLAGVSPLYETAPVGLEEQPAFLNAVLVVDTTLFPSELLGACKRAEAAAGRVPGVRWGPRPLDVDILLYGDLSLRGPDLEIPHPRLVERAFVLRPLLDLLPDAALPGGRLLAPLAEATADQEVRQVAGPEWAAPEPETGPPAGPPAPAPAGECSP